MNEIDDENPVFLDFKRNLKLFSNSVSKFRQTQDGKSIPNKYWDDVEDLLKKSKLSIAMIELGIDQIDTEVGSELKLTPMGDTRDGDEQFDKEEEEEEKEQEEKEKEEEEKEKEKESTGDKSDVKESASSKSQQRLFGMVHAYNNGELKKSDVGGDLYDKIKKIANKMKQADVKKLAKTHHDDLPEKVPTDELYDIANHIKILLDETYISDVSEPTLNDSEFYINSNYNNNNFKLHYIDSKFYMTSENYKFELGDAFDLSEVVSKFTSLVNNTETDLIRDYQFTLNR
jgi:cobalamin biosynthesis protein CobT